MTLPNTFTPTTPADANQVNENFEFLLSLIESLLNRSSGIPRPITAAEPLTATDRHVVMISATDQTLTLRPTAEMLATGAFYSFTQIGAGVLTLQVDGAVIYDLGGEVDSYIVEDAETIVFKAYLRPNNTPGLIIHTSS